MISLKDEIKEILKYLKESNINGFGYEQDKLIAYEEAQVLLDYITNLQEKNEKLKVNCNIGNENLTFYRNSYYEKEQELDKYKNIIKLLKHFGENSLGIIYALKDNVEPTENEWLNLIEYEKYLRELKGDDK